MYFMSQTDQELQLKEIQRIIADYDSDLNQVGFTYTLSELKLQLMEIKLILENKKCVHCRKLLTFSDFCNSECSVCGFQLMENKS